ncbi:oxidoreductase [Gemmobacter lanyuensis]|uniref:Oxidoreductase n=1 Tax=Gemmobacter lanyuensis TaxID=1054497 RepID=A0A918IR64_9RHOB|nr:oxidoreductase [Gemmobacter lanyuensis]GGW26647.1 oxidoreductase [Gemmobacter lanyuensis]
MRAIWGAAVARVLGALCVLIALGAVPAQAVDAEILLRLRGPDGKEVVQTREMLDALPEVRIRTSTIWTEGEIEFSGPALLTVLKEVGITSGRVRLAALNDYVIELNVADMTDDYPILAIRRDGKSFGVRDNGPIWVIYPYDAGAMFATERIYASSVWQLVRIEAVAP